MSRVARGDMPKAVAAAFCALSALSLTLAGFGPAVAAPPGSTPIDGHVEYTAQDWCGVDGLTVEVDGHASGWEIFRSRGPGSPDYYASHGLIVETHTANGVTTTFVERTLDKDLVVVDQGETIVVTVLATGNSTLYGPDGKAIARNPGQFRYRITLDAATGEVLVFEPLLGSTGRTDDYCEAEVAVFAGS